MDAEAFFLAPHTAWAMPNSPAVLLADSIRAAGGTASSGEFGYIDLLSTSYGVLAVWYDSKTGNGTTECRIMTKSV
jgi:hypothetical protein